MRFRARSTVDLIPLLDVIMIVLLVFMSSFDAGLQEKAGRYDELAADLEACRRKGLDQAEIQAGLYEKLVRAEKEADRKLTAQAEEIVRLEKENRELALADKGRRALEQALEETLKEKQALMEELDRTGAELERLRETAPEIGRVQELTRQAAELKEELARVQERRRQELGADYEAQVEQEELAAWVADRFWIIKINLGPEKNGIQPFEINGQAQPFLPGTKDEALEMILRYIKENQAGGRSEDKILFELIAHPEASGRMVLLTEGALLKGRFNFIKFRIAD